MRGRGIPEKKKGRRRKIDQIGTTAENSQSFPDSKGKDEIMPRSWSGRLWSRLAILVVVLGGTVGGVWLASGSFGQDQQEPPPNQASVPSPKTQTVAQVDPSKVSADSPKAVPQAVKPKELGTELKGEPSERKGEPKEAKGQPSERKGEPKEGKGQPSEPKGEPRERKGEGSKRKGEFSKPKDDVKPVSLVEAVTLAEKSGQGQAVRAEKQGTGSRTRFSVDLLGAEGVRTRVRLTATGKILDSQPLGQGLSGKRPEREREWEE
jgi:hypothetical protein